MIGRAVAFIRIGFFEDFKRADALPIDVDAMACMP